MTNTSKKTNNNSAQKNKNCSNTMQNSTATNTASLEKNLHKIAASFITKSTLTKTKRTDQNFIITAVGVTVCSYT